VRKHIGKRSVELIHKHILEAITTDIGGNDGFDPTLIGDRKHEERNIICND
jgi:hypothetical protein